MTALVYRICALLALVLTRVPIGTNQGLFSLHIAAVRCSEAALSYGRWQTQDLRANWQKAVAQEGQFVPGDYEGIQPVACDLTAFFRPQLRALEGKPWKSKHYRSPAGKALQAVVLGVCVAVGRVGATRLGLPRLMLRREPDETEAALQKRLIGQAAQTLAPTEALIVDAGFSLSDLLAIPGLRYVAPVRSNVTARRQRLLKALNLPETKGQQLRRKRLDFGSSRLVRLSSRPVLYCLGWHREKDQDARQSAGHEGDSPLPAAQPGPRGPASMLCRLTGELVIVGVIHG